MIIAAFPGCGKTTLGRKYANVIDLESSVYKYIFEPGVTHKEIEARKATPRIRNDQYPYNYVDAIQKANRQYEIVLTSCGTDVKVEMERRGLEYVLVYPTIECKEEYLNRYQNRGNHPNFIASVGGRFEELIHDDDINQHRHFILNPGEYLEGKLIEEGIIVIKEK